MKSEILARLRALLGNEGASTGADGVPRALPDSIESLAQVCHVAHAEGWKVRVEGEGGWLPPDAPADLAVSTRALDSVTRGQCVGPRRHGAGRHRHGRASAPAGGA